MSQRRVARGASRAGRSKAGSVMSAHCGCMSPDELRMEGFNKVAYIKVLTSEQAKSIYPTIDDLPSGIQLYCLSAADGSPIALTDSIQAAMGHAIGDELEVASLN